MKVVLIGAGSAQFGYHTIGEIVQSSALEGAEIFLHDINAESLRVVYETASDFLKEHNVSCSVKAGIDRKEALEGADFVIISIEVGDRFALWEQDWRIPQQYGIRQVYGENGGAGGLFHSLRIIPPILAICEDIEKICPEAVVFNFSNPMSRICTTIGRKFPDLHFVGLCHEIFSLPEHLPKLLKTPFENIKFRAGGLNHFSALLEVSYVDSGENAYPDVLKVAEEYFSRLPGYSDYLQHYLKTGELSKSSESRRKFHEQGTVRSWGERGLFKIILEEFNLLPITTDSHFGEYISWAYEVSDHKGIMDFYEYYKNSLGSVKPEINLKKKERAIPIMEGILTNAGFEEAAVNIPNMGCIAELPDFIAVEIPAKISSSGIEGIKLDSLHKGFAGLLRNQVAVHDLTAEAVLTGSKKAVVHALMVDSVVDRYKFLKELVDVMVDRQKDYLGYLS